VFEKMSAPDRSKLWPGFHVSDPLQDSSAGHDNLLTRLDTKIRAFAYKRISELDKLGCNRNGTDCKHSRATFP
jgi:hypothetical protein